METAICAIIERALDNKLKEIGRRQPEHYTAEEVADIMSVDVQSIRRLCKRGEIKSVRDGKMIRIQRKEFLEWLNRIRVESKR